MPKRYYITTPIYYVNSVPHLGTALTTLASDVTARFQRMRGRDPFFLTGTDENGIKVLEAAQNAGEPPQEFVDRISETFRTCWADMDIRYDDFIRTTEQRHVETVQRVFVMLRDAGHIYRGKYEGWYDVSSETFYKESDLVDGRSPDGNEVRWIEEDNWFFRLSGFQDRLLEHIGANPKFVVPESRKNEVVSFMRQGLRDACITRANPGWGIAVPGDEEKVVYVWFDALINYLSATGWPESGWEELWPAEVEWMAKDILTRFHATLWPAMLMGLGLPLPSTLVGHGWLQMSGEKISKSKGNVVAPMELAGQLSAQTGCDSKLAVDAVRYYLAATMPYESDSSFTDAEFRRRYEADLANDLGNALNRTLAMAQRFCSGIVPDGAIEPEVATAITSARDSCAAALEDFRLDHGATAAWELVRFLNKYIDTAAPWALAKSGDARLGSVMRSMLLCLHSIAGLIQPFMPSAASEILRQLGASPIEDWNAIGDQRGLPPGGALLEPTPMYPRFEKVESKRDKQQKPAQPPPAAPATAGEAAVVTIDEFRRIELRVARILEAEPVEGSEKLLRLQVVVGGERRQVLAGLKKSHTPLDLIGRQVVIVANLKPAKLMGMESRGMLLAADGPEGEAILLAPEVEAPEGASVH